MKFFIDTANLDQIREANELGVLDGVTTNPSLMAKEGIRGVENQRKHYLEICEIVGGDVSAEVIATDLEGMIKEGESDWFLDSIDALVELEEWSGQDALSEVARQAQARGLRIFLPESWKDFAGVGYEYFNLDAGPGVRDCAN